MNTTGIEQVTYLQFLDVPSLPPPSQRLKNAEVVLRTDGKKYRCTGIGWIDASGTASVGSLDAASPIAGNPAGLQTPGQLASTIQAQAAQIAALQAFLKDADFDGRLDAASQQSNEYDFPVPSLVWNIPHGFGRKPEITCYDLTGTELDNPPRQDPSNNTSIITWLVPQAGKAVCS